MLHEVSCQPSQMVLILNLAFLSPACFFQTAGGIKEATITAVLVSISILPYIAVSVKASFFKYKLSYAKIVFLKCLFPHHPPPSNSKLSIFYKNKQGSHACLK